MPPQNDGGHTTEKLLRQQAALAAFGTFAFREDDLHKILTEAARVCAEGLGVPFCKVCRYRAAENDLLIVAGVGWHSGVVGQVVSPADETSPQGRAYVTRQPVLINNLHAINDIRLPPFYAEHGIISTIDVVIQTQSGAPYGVLEIDSPFEHAYDEHDINFLTGFTNVLAEAVSTHERIELLRVAVAERDALILDKTVMAEEMQHRVRNNLQLVHAMLEREVNDPDTSRMSDNVAAIGRRIMTMSRVYDHLLGTGMARTIDFGAYLSALCHALPEIQDPDGSGGGITVRCDVESVTLSLDSVTSLGLVVTELVANSYRHAFPGGHGSITVTLRRGRGGGDSTLRISDDGVGLPHRPSGNRRGLGLATRLMQQVKGTIAQADGPGTTWLLTFPPRLDAAA